MAGHLGRLIARVPFWIVHPHHDRATLLPDGASVNILTDLKSHCVIQLMRGAGGEKIVLEAKLSGPLASFGPGRIVTPLILI